VDWNATATPEVLRTAILKKVSAPPTNTNAYLCGAFESVACGNTSSPTLSSELPTVYYEQMELPDDEVSLLRSKQTEYFDSVLNHPDPIDVSESTVPRFDDCTTIADFAKKFTLNDGQRLAFYIVAERILLALHNKKAVSEPLFVGGPAGTGKSQIIKALVGLFARLGLQLHVKIAAPTGSAADNCGGTTVHSRRKRHKLKKSNTPPSAQILELRIGQCKFLVLDEISMCTGELLSSLNTSMMAAANNNLPFGGAIVLFFGDFAQYPPTSLYPLYVNQRSNQDHLFARKYWRDTVQSVCLLTEPMRSTCSRLLPILNFMRSKGDPEIQSNLTLDEAYKTLCERVAMHWTNYS
jgi:hypothetical protein